MESPRAAFLPTFFALMVTTTVFMFWEDLSLEEADKTILPRIFGSTNPICSSLDLEGNSSKSVSCSFQKHASDLTLFLGENEVIKMRESIRYHRNLPTICDDDVDLLIMIVSKVGEYDNRNAVRETWKRSETFKEEMSRTKTVFLIPSMSDEHERRNREEVEKYNDIIQIQFYGNERTAILLEAIALTWFKKYCYNAKYYLKTSDKFMLNPKAIKSILASLDASTDLTFPTMYGRIAARSPVIRHGDGSTCEFFYPFDTYPTYMRDETYLMHREVVLKLDSALDHSYFFPLADVYLSGLTAAIADIKREDSDKITSDFKDGFWEEAKSLGYIAENSGQMRERWTAFIGKTATKR